VCNFAQTGTGSVAGSAAAFNIYIACTFDVADLGYGGSGPASGFGTLNMANAAGALCSPGNPSGVSSTTTDHVYGHWKAQLNVPSGTCGTYFTTAFFASATTYSMQWVWDAPGSIRFGVSSGTFAAGVSVGSYPAYPDYVWTASVAASQATYTSSGGFTPAVDISVASGVLAVPDTGTDCGAWYHIGCYMQVSLRWAFVPSDSNMADVLSRMTASSGMSAWIGSALTAAYAGATGITQGELCQRTGSCSDGSPFGGIGIPGADGQPGMVAPLTLGGASQCTGPESVLNVSGVQVVRMHPLYTCDGLNHSIAVFVRSWLLGFLTFEFVLASAGKVATVVFGFDMSDVAGIRGSVDALRESGDEKTVKFR